MRALPGARSKETPESRSPQSYSPPASPRAARLRRAPPLAGCEPHADGLAPCAKGDHTPGLCSRSTHQQPNASKNMRPIASSSPAATMADRYVHPPAPTTHGDCGTNQRRCKNVQRRPPRCETRPHRRPCGHRRASRERFDLRLPVVVGNCAQKWAAFRVYATASETACAVAHEG
jgi:hypothetical protein